MPGSNPGAINADLFIQGIFNGDRTVLAQAITLIESKASAHRAAADKLLQAILPRTGKAKRIGVTGVPGVGKSTFIEAFGCLLCSEDHKVAVLTVDPSSARTGGSILGDKTRMERLSQLPNAFIRPTPSGETLGGVARKTRETMLVCEAAGFDTILVETVGVGQSEVTVRSMVDFFLLMMLPGGGDELQGIKKGVVELADALFVNKADGKNRELAEISQREYATALHYVPPATRGWKTLAYIGSAMTGEGIPEIWNVIKRFYETLGAQGFIEDQRRTQSILWLRDIIRDELNDRFFKDDRVRKLLPELEESLFRNQTTASAAAKELFERLEIEKFSNGLKGDSYDSKD